MGCDTSAQGGRLHCHKFDCWVAEQDALCSKPDGYCEHRDRCSLYFMMVEREDSKKLKSQEDSDALV